ncbi:hypothetical protein BGW36DRAFT_443015 [Talaromyces proteolyticus]|uniref:Uncharacterized protein n=1 Tax=Talaromyces proteolyticus TaxID=1131652 RepID=A0AAD4L1Z5_9EURO|nr:uncharacterized protein BGW36DRAFT_443015 [Talaromyces proteolyticus]KAH8703014.1 hypothetical protein BGW36DRAFT_443015 [Talaromyces proteolyticus]
MLHINPVLSYADLELPLPGPRQLWEAKSAIEWKEIYLYLEPLGTERLPSLVDLLQDMSQLRAFQGRIDTHAVAFVLLHGIAALIKEYHRLRFISKGHCKHWNALLISSRHQELCAALQYFRTVCSALQDPPRPEIDLVYEATSIFLYASLEELQLFAGKEDKNEARRVYHSALEWINSVDSRRAILHAGQTVRAAKAIPVVSLRGFLAITVYHASLEFWSYSVVSRTKTNPARAMAISGSSPQVVRSPPEMVVFLDAEETPDVQKFISLACGDPALQGLQGTASLV